MMPFRRESNIWRCASRCVAAAAMLWASTAAAQVTDSIPDRHASSVAELDRITSELSLSEDTVARLTASIATLRKDHATITAALIQSAKTERKLAEDVEEISARLEQQKSAEAALRRSLWERRDVLAEVLGGLQRMGLNPPPAILVTPDDALASVRSAILLGAVVPELREQTDRLLADLNELSRLTTSIQAERDRLAQTAMQMATEKQRLTMLQAEKERIRTESDAVLATERKRSAELAKQAGSLKELISSLENEARKRAKADELAREKEARRLKRENELAEMPVPEANRLVGSAPFSASHGKLMAPAAGKRSKRFGEKDGLGGRWHGDTLATQSGSIVTTPVDAQVLYAGPFRSYRQLLILDAGDGYLVVLAGMDRISVAQGQSILAGEPVGAMGEARTASAAAGVENVTPELYVEFRKNGKSVDPDPWWADR
jgi:septal ring factor EnvC (AmiA/AmiB activator)